MSTLVIERPSAIALNVVVTDDALVVDLSDGRSVSVPIAWYPRLLHATPEERGHWRIIGCGEGVHWSDIDEDISVESILNGQPSAENQRSLQKWLAQRMNKREDQ